MLKLRCFRFDFQRPWHSAWRSAYHGISYCCTRSADPVSPTCDGYKGDQTVTEWRQMPQGHCMLLSAFDSTASTAYLSVANWYKSCKWSRMRPPVLSKEPEDQSTWRLFYVIFTGCRFHSGSCLKQQFWSTSVCTAWLHGTFRCIASRRQQSPAGVFDLLTPADWLFHAPEQTTATAASLFKDLECATVFLLNFVPQTSRWWRSETDLRHSCSMCNCYPVHLQLLRDLALYKCQTCKVTK